VANVMTTGGTIACAHGGTATLTSNAKLKVNNVAVLLEDQVTSWTIAPGCGQTSGSSIPCASFLSFTGKAQKLKVGGKAVVLDTFSGTTNGKPDSTTNPANAGQSKLKAS
jgi:hypothetical protein